MQDMAGGTTVHTVNEKYDYVLDTTSCADSTLDGDEPSEGERQTLRKVADKLPWSAFLVAMVELCERFAYYGLSGPFQVRC